MGKKWLSTENQTDFRSVVIFKALTLILSTYFFMFFEELLSSIQFYKTPMNLKSENKFKMFMFSKTAKSTSEASLWFH